MSLLKLAETIGNRIEIQSDPPVLMDIGASGDLNPIWKTIAKFSIGVAFDADDRDFIYENRIKSTYKKLYVINRIVVDQASAETLPFYLTKKPHCSSLLEPMPEMLDPYDFADYFTLDKVVLLKAVELKDTLEQLGITRIDWFKADSQGTDLRLFKSLPLEMQKNALIAEFEPGIIDVYKGGDTLIDVMQYLYNKNFRLAGLKVKGPLHIKQLRFNKLFLSDFSKKIARHSLYPTPGWAELLYINNMNSTQLTVREFMLGWLFASLLRLDGQALAIANEGTERFKDPLFAQLEIFSTKRLKNEPFTVRGLMRLFTFAANKYLIA